MKFQLRGKIENKDAKGTAHYPGWNLPVLEFLYQDRKITASGHETTDTDPGLATTKDLETYMLHFVSVTYGAGGSTRDLTHHLVERIQHTTKLDPIPHVTCVCHNEKEIEDILVRYAKSAIGNILALGGDRPHDIPYDKSRDSFQHAIDLVKFIRRFNESGAHPDPRGFGVGVAGFPEGHPATPNRLIEMDHFKAKVDAGADY